MSLPYILLENIFTKPFSYIWGAPGTGKTQFVLSYAVLHYIQSGDTIAILAPTNNAIEQVLRGVIKMTDKAGVDRKQIIRLGTPSKKFAEIYPQVCEEKGLQKRMDEIDKQINILQRMLDFYAQKQALSEFNGIVSEFDKISGLGSKIKAEQDLFVEINNQSNKKEKEIKSIDEALLKQNQELIKSIAKTKSIFQKVFKFFTSKPTSIEILIAKIEVKILNYKSSVQSLKYELSKIDSDKAVRESSIRKNKELALGKIEAIKRHAQGLPEIGAFISGLSIDNVTEIKTNVSSALFQAIEKLEIDEYLFDEYKALGFVDIKYELDNYVRLRNKLAASSTEERLKSVNIIACTLDGYIGRFAKEKLAVEHIFLDEAGYSNMIKALTLFNHAVPITFLGDHKQLPPVCEISDTDIEKNTRFYNMFLWAQSAVFIDMLFSDSKDNCRDKYLKNSEFIPISISKTSLNSTYRFGSNLARILSKYVYANDFKSNNIEGETKILYANAPKAEGMKSRISMSEVSEIRKIIDALKRSENNDFVILTPYKKQIELLNRYLPQERNDLKILTVHGSQGREWDTVILSVVDTYDKWFVDTAIPISKGLNLVNTAVSRAKRNLIIVCDKNYWIEQRGQLITELINCGQEIQN